MKRTFFTSLLLLLRAMPFCAERTSVRIDVKMRTTIEGIKFGCGKILERAIGIATAE